MSLQMALFHSFLWPSSIPLFIYTLHPFSHLSISGHSGCFHILTIINNAALNIGVHVSFQIIVLFRGMSRSKIAGSCDNSSFSFLRNLHTVSILDVQIYIPTSSVGEFPFLHILSSIIVYRFF